MAACLALTWTEVKNSVNWVCPSWLRWKQADLQTQQVRCPISAISLDLVGLLFSSRFLVFCSFLFGLQLRLRSTLYLPTSWSVQLDLLQLLAGVMLMRPSQLGFSALQLSGQTRQEIGSDCKLRCSYTHSVLSSSSSSYTSKIAVEKTRCLSTIYRATAETFWLIELKLSWFSLQWAAARHSLGDQTPPNRVIEPPQ